MKKLYLTLVAAAVAFSAMAFDSGKRLQTRNQPLEFTGEGQTHRIVTAVNNKPKRAQSKVQLPDPTTARELSGEYIFHYMGYLGSDVNLSHHNPGYINLIATDNNNVKIGPFIWNVYFDAEFDATTHTLTIKNGQEQPILSSNGTPTNTVLTIYDHNVDYGEKGDITMLIDAANHIISWESVSSIVEVCQVGKDVPAASLMGIYFDYANTMMVSYDITRYGLEGPYDSLLWIEPTTDGKISVSNFCDLGTLAPLTLEIDQVNRTATADNSVVAFGDPVIYLWQLDVNNVPSSTVVTFESGTFNAEGYDEINAQKKLAIMNPQVGAVDESASQGYLFADVQILMPFDPFSTGITDIEADSAAPAEYFNLQGIRVDKPGKGMYIMRQGNISRKVIL